MELIKTELYNVCSYTIKDGNVEFDVSEVLGTENEILILFYEEGMNIAIYSIFECRGRFEYGQRIRLFDGKNEDLDYEDELNVMIGYIIEQHNKDNEILK